MSQNYNHMKYLSLIQQNNELFLVQNCRKSHIFLFVDRGFGNTVTSVLTHSPVTSEVGGSNPGPYVGKLVVYSTEP